MPDQVRDRSADYWSTGDGADQETQKRYVDDYWGESNTAAIIQEFDADNPPWTIETAEDIAELSPSGVDYVGPDRNGPSQNPPDNSGLAYPPHVPPGANEIGYGKYGAPSPLIPSRQAMLEQAVVITVAERLVTDMRPILVQNKVAEHCHMETFPFLSGAYIGSNGIPIIQVGYRHANAIGFQVIASGSGLYIGEDQSVGTGNQGIPVPVNFWLPINANCNLFISTANAALSQAVSLYVVQYIMGHASLSGGEDAHDDRMGTKS